jgi:hypothetical protein
MSQPTPAQLKAELTADPKARGYAASITASNWGAVAAKLNSTYAGVGVVYRSSIPNYELQAAILPADFGLLATNGKGILLQILLANRMVDGTSANIRGQFSSVFAAGTTLTALGAVAQVAAPTRAQELWGDTASVSAEDCAIAYAS